MIRIKVCGMKEPNNILAVAGYSPDYLGFIFYPSSKRFVGPDFAIPASLPESIKRVGVFVNETVENSLDLVARHRLDAVQLHGDELAVDCKKLKPHVTVIKAFGVDESFDFAMTKSYVPFVDYFLFDTKSKEYGGTGRSFDWTVLSRYDQPVPFFLSGGLAPSNISAALALSHPMLYAIDLNSGVEVSPGNKDLKKVEEAFQLIRSHKNVESKIN